MKARGKEEKKQAEREKPRRRWSEKGQGKKQIRTLAVARKIGTAMQPRTKH